MNTKLRPYDFQLAEIHTFGLELATKADELVIGDDEIDAFAKELLAIVTKKLKAAEDLRVETKAPALAECQKIDDAFKIATEPFKTAKKLIAEKTGAYFKVKKDAEEAAQREAERLEREQIAKRARLTAEAEAKGQELAPAPLPAPTPAPVPEIASVTKTEAGTVGMVKNRGFRVLDESRIPDEYWVLDLARIAQCYKAGADVPGCVEEITYSPRTR